MHMPLRPISVSSCVFSCSVLRPITSCSGENDATCRASPRSVWQTFSVCVCVCVCVSESLGDVVDERQDDQWRRLADVRRFAARQRRRRLPRFFSAVNMSALAQLMTSFGANDSRTLTSAGTDTFKTLVDTMTLYVTPRHSSARSVSP